MIHEYAIDPELVVTWGKDRKDCRYFFNEFGLGTSRFMAEFPNFKKWRKQFRQAWATAGDNEQKRIEELFKRITEKRVCRLDQDYDTNRTWLENAEAENRRQGFQAILSVDNPRGHVQVLSATALDNLLAYEIARFLCSQGTGNGGSAFPSVDQLLRTALYRSTFPPQRHQASQTARRIS